MERPLFIPGARGLVGEFYQLVLAAAYHADGLWGEATFDLYPRELPEGWGFLVASGLEPALQAVESLAFSADEIRLLREHPVFAKVPGDFFDMLAELRFDGQVAAVPEGTPIFPGEPVMRLTGSLIACTLLETRLLQLVGASTAVATRAARLCLAAGEAAVYDFGSRRNSSGTAALMAARAAYIGGAAGTTNAAASLLLGVPAFGTMSSTFLATYGDDQLAYDAFRLHFPTLGHYTLPDDDPVDGVRRFGRARERVSIVRIDHDDLARGARTVREALDRHGMREVRILGSGHLDEHRVEKLRANRAPIDCFAVGRALAHTGEPGTRMAFRIAEMQRGPAWVPVTRQGSSTWPGKKQVVRFADHDLVCLD
ncbi:MAG: hypothetical protein FJ102_06235, partial [Deltaproteobacteria bacterium]|nr:hypothetical protein [Deltaproteobacteria bacterium]